MKLKTNKSLKELTTFKIGGKSNFFLAPKNFNEMKQAYQFAKEKELKKIIIGNGSNILIKDDFFEGLTILNKINFLKIIKTDVYVGAGYSLMKLAKISSEKSLSGLEFGFGIPGSIGGAIYMNASSYDESISNCLIKVKYLDESGKIKTLKKEDIDFGYRFSSFQNFNGIILSCHFKLKYDKNAKTNLKFFFEKKRSSQPLDKFTAGCIFKNPKNLFAAKLIDESGLKNYKIGQAKISSIHANFIENEGGASFNDVIKLIKHVKNKVKTKKNILLEEEIKILP